MQLTRVAGSAAIAVPLLVAAVAGRERLRSASPSCATLLAASVCTSVVKKNGVPVEIHATIPMTLISGVAPDAPMQWPPAQLGAVPLPTEARAAFGLDHLGINWEAHGHPPATFMAPHFDFHFYSVSPAAVAAIDCRDTTKPAAAPAGFDLPDLEIPQLGTLTGLCVPNMGMHAVTHADLQAGEPFGASLLIGYYQAKPIFVEPMVTQARLLERKSFTLDVPAMANLPEGVRYPRTIRGFYDTDRQEYRLILSGF